MTYNVLSGTLSLYTTTTTTSSLKCSDMALLIRGSHSFTWHVPTPFHLSPSLSNSFSASSATSTFQMLPTAFYLLYLIPRSLLHTFQTVPFIIRVFCSQFNFPVGLYYRELNLLLLLLTGTPVLQLLLGRFCGFSPRKGDKFHWLSSNLAWRRGPSRMPCQISCRSHHICGFLHNKQQKFQSLQTYSPHMDQFCTGYSWNLWARVYKNIWNLVPFSAQGKEL